MNFAAYRLHGVLSALSVQNKVSRCSSNRSSRYIAIENRCFTQAPIYAGPAVKEKQIGRSVMRQDFKQTRASMSARARSCAGTQLHARTLRVLKKRARVCSVSKTSSRARTG